MNISALLLQHAERLEPALIHRERTISFTELEALSGRIAHLLSLRGVQPRDPVLVFQPMGIELYAILLALFRLGAVAMFLDPSAGREHLELCCRVAPPKAFIAAPKAHLLRLFSPAIRRIPQQWTPDSLVRKSRMLTSLPFFPCAPEHPALLTFTSGSTGFPKAAVRSHGFLVTQHRILLKTLRLQVGEVDLSTMPIFVLANLASGLTSLIPNADLRSPGRIEPAPVIAEILKHGPACTVASPALLELLADMALERGITFPSFRRIFSGGAPVFPRLLQKLKQVAPGAEIYAAYGSTEAEPIAHIELSHIREADFNAMLSGQGLLVGAPIEDIRVAILPDRWGTPIGPFLLEEFEQLRLSPGEIGELVVSGEHVLPGYLNGSGDEQTKFRVSGQSWHRTGDAVSFDEEGRLWLLGRCSARIEDVRGTLYPFAVECAATHEPGVQRAALFAHRGKRILALEGLDVLPSCFSESLDWAKIDQIELMRKIPVDKRHNAKIDYPALERLVR